MSPIKYKKTKFNHKVSDKRVQVAVNVNPPTQPPHPGRSGMQNLRDGAVVLALLATGYDIYQGEDSKLKEVFGEPDININVRPVVTSGTNKSSLTLREAMDLLNTQDSLNKANNVSASAADTTNIPMTADTTTVMQRDTTATVVKLDTLNL
jgi:hypothetical protein